MELNSDIYNNNNIIRKAKEKIRKITTGWGYKNAITSKTNKAVNNLNRFWIDLYISKSIPPMEEIQEAKSIKDLGKYNLKYVCAENADTLAEAYIKLLRYIELMDISIKSLNSKKKEQKGERND